MSCISARNGHIKLADGECCRCEPHPISLSCDMIAADKTKCGFGGFGRTDPDNPDDPVVHFYLTGHVVADVSFDCDVGGDNTCHSEDHADETYTCDRHNLGGGASTQGCFYTATGSNSAAASCTGGPGGVYSESDSETCDDDSNTQGTHCSCYVETCGGECGQFGLNEWCGGGAGLDCSTSSGLTFDESTYTATGTATGGGTNRRDYSDEYTTEMLIEDVVALLPAYDGTFDNHPCSAYRHLSPNETSYQIRRLKPRFTFDSSSSSRTLTYKTFFGPDIGMSELVEEFSVAVPAFATSVDGEEIFEPSENGTITIGETSLGFCTGCMQVSATLSGHLQQSNACSPCAGFSTACVTDVSAAATPYFSTNEGSNSCGECVCVARSTVAYIYRDVPDSGVCVGDEPLPCSCPDSDSSDEGFQVEVGLHNVAATNICFDTLGYWVSIFVYLSKSGCPNQSMHDFVDTGILYYLGTDPPSGAHTFTFDEAGLMGVSMGGTAGCGLEGLNYEVVVTFP